MAIGIDEGVVDGFGYHPLPFSLISIWCEGQLSPSDRASWGGQ